MRALRCDRMLWGAGLILILLAPGCGGSPAPMAAKRSRPDESMATPTGAGETALPAPDESAPPVAGEAPPSFAAEPVPQLAPPLEPEPEPDVETARRDRAEHGPPSGWESGPSTAPSPVPRAIPKLAPPMAAKPAEEPATTAEAPEPASVYHYRAQPEEERAQPSDANKGYTIVKVYYGTDRGAIDPDQWARLREPGWPRVVTVLACLSALLMAPAYARQGRVWLRALAWTCMTLTMALGGLTVYARFQPEPAGRKLVRMYGPDRGSLEMGTCEVSIPESHETGELESPSVLRLEFRDDPLRHVTLMTVKNLPAHEFFQDLRQCVEQSREKQAFVFIHGYNVRFEDAARRTAQIAYDLKFHGAPILYSWPSQASLASYAVDETNVVWTVPHLKEFLVQVARQSGAKDVHLVAHSMGNRALTAALREMTYELDENCPKFREVVLTAPDIDAEVFRRDLAPAIVKSAGRVTLYASSNDEALIASKRFHGYARAGDSGSELVVVPGVDTVDVSAVDTSFLGHSYYGSNDTVLADLFELIHAARPPDQRTWLRAASLGVLRYWLFVKDRLTIRPPTATGSREPF